MIQFDLKQFFTKLLRHGPHGGQYVPKNLILVENHSQHHMIDDIN